MRYFLPLLLAVFSASAVVGAEPLPIDGPPELRGVLIAGGVRQFSLVAPGSGSSAWAKVGDSFAGWEITDFKLADETLTLKKASQVAVLKLADNAVKDGGAAPTAKATLADAEDVFRKMDFDRMMTRIVEQQKASMAQMMSRGGPSGDPVAKAALQKKIMDTMFDAMDLPGMKNDMVKVYSEVFTKDELHGLSDFYGTPSGQAMIDKQPEISKRMNELLIPRMMSAGPKIQELQKQFAAEQAAKTSAGTTGTAAPAPATAPTPIP